MDMWNICRGEADSKRDYRDDFVCSGTDAMMWRMREFVTPRQIDDAMRRASDYAALVIDLRGNGGGADDALLRLAGSLIARVDTIAFEQWRDRRVPEVSKATDHPHTGQGIYLGEPRLATVSEAVGNDVTRRGR